MDGKKIMENKISLSLVIMQSQWCLSLILLPSSHTALVRNKPRESSSRPDKAPVTGLSHWTRVMPTAYLTRQTIPESCLYDWKSRYY